MVSHRSAALTLPVLTHLGESGQFESAPPPDSTRPHKLATYTVTGLATGAVLGAIGGGVGSRYAGCGCSQTQKVAGFAVWFGSIGAGAGALVGALVGIVHDHRP
jgi:hypothetical protein